jgi:hypothetical protein
LVVGQSQVVTTLPSTDIPFRPVVDDFRAVRKSLHRVYMLLMVPVVPFAVFVTGTVLRFFFPETSSFMP